MFHPKLLPDSDISESVGFKASFAPEKANRSFSSHLRLDPRDLELVAHLFRRIYREYSEKRVG